MKYKSILTALAATAALTFSGVAIGAAYRVIELQTLPGTYGGSAIAINNSGQVVGYVYTDTGGNFTLPSIWTSGQLQTIAPPGGAATGNYGADINDSGTVVGRYYNPGGGYGRAFYYDGVFRDVSGAFDAANISEGSGSDLAALNNSGVAVGRGGAYGGYGGVTYAPATGASLLPQLPDAFKSQVNAGLGSANPGYMLDWHQLGAINDSGDVAGAYYVRLNNYHDPVQRAFAVINGVPIDLGLPTDRTSYASFIGDDGTVLGTRYSALAYGDSNGRGFIFDGAFHELSVVGATVLPHAVGPDGEVIGWVASGAYGYGFVYRDGLLTDINAEIVENPSGAHVWGVFDINDSGWMVGAGRLGSRFVPILLQPVQSQGVPEPSTLALLVGVFGAWTLGASHRSPRRDR